MASTRLNLYRPEPVHSKLDGVYDIKGFNSPKFQGLLASEKSLNRLGVNLYGAQTHQESFTGANIYQGKQDNTANIVIMIGPLVLDGYSDRRNLLSNGFQNRTIPSIQQPNNQQSILKASRSFDPRDLKSVLSAPSLHKGSSFEARINSNSIELVNQDILVRKIISEMIRLGIPKASSESFIKKIMMSNIGTTLSGQCLTGVELIKHIQQLEEQLNLARLEYQKVLGALVATEK